MNVRSMKIYLQNTKVYAETQDRSWHFTLDPEDFISGLEIFISEFPELVKLVITDDQFESAHMHSPILIESDVLEYLALTNISMFRIVASNLKILHLEHLNKLDLQILPSADLLIISPFAFNKHGGIVYHNGVLLSEHAEHYLLKYVDHYMLLSSSNPIKRILQTLEELRDSGLALDVIVGGNLNFDYNI